MDLSKSGYVPTEEEDVSEEEIDVEEDDDSEEEDTDEDAAIALAIGSEDPDRIESFIDAVKICISKYK